MTSDGTVIAAIAAGVATDAAGNTNTASTSTDNTVTRDATAPTVSRSAARHDADERASVSWTVTFSETVTGVDTADFSLSPRSPARRSRASRGNGTTYTVTVSTGTGSGTLQLNLVDNDTIQDAATNKLGGTGAGNGNFSGEAYTIDKVSATVTANQAAGQADPTNQSPISFTVTFSEPVTGFTATRRHARRHVRRHQGRRRHRRPERLHRRRQRHDRRHRHGERPAGAASDAAGNANSASTSTDNTVTYDATAPIVTLATPANNSHDRQHAGLPGTGGKLARDVNLITIKIYSGSTATGSPVQTLTDTLDAGGNYNVSSATLADGTYTAQAQQDDTAGNTGFSSANTFTVDTVKPERHDQPGGGQDDPTNTVPINFTVVFSEPVSALRSPPTSPSAGRRPVARSSRSRRSTRRRYTVAITATGGGTVIPTVAGWRRQRPRRQHEHRLDLDRQHGHLRHHARPTVTINQAAARPTRRTPRRSISRSSSASRSPASRAPM